MVSFKKLSYHLNGLETCIILVLGSHYIESYRSRHYVWVFSVTMRPVKEPHTRTDYYYFATAGGRRIWWKKYLTSLQITQFIIDLFAVYFASK